MRSNCGRTALKSIRRSTPRSTVVEPTTPSNRDIPSVLPGNTTTTLSNSPQSSVSSTAVTSGGFSAYTPQSLLPRVSKPHRYSIWAAHSTVEQYVDRAGFRMANQLPPRWRQLSLKVTKSMALSWGVVLFCVVVVGASRLVANWYLCNFTTLEPIGSAAVRRRLRRDLLFKHGLECHCSACKAAGLGMGSGTSSPGGDSESSITLHHHSGGIGSSDAPISTAFNSSSIDLVEGGSNRSGGDVSEVVRGMCRIPVLLWISEEHPILMVVSVMVLMPLVAEVGVASWFHSRSRRYNAHMASLLQAQLKRSSPSTSKQLDDVSNVSQPVVSSRSGTKRRRYAPQSKWANMNTTGAEVPSGIKPSPSGVTPMPMSMVGSVRGAQLPQPHRPPAPIDHWGRARGLKLFRQLMLAQWVYTQSHIISLVLVGLTLEMMYIIALIQ